MTKKCGKCKKDKPPGQFHDGQHYCKSCMCAYNREWRKQQGFKSFGPRRYANRKAVEELTERAEWRPIMSVFRQNGSYIHGKCGKELQFKGFDLANVEVWYCLSCMASVHIPPEMVSRITEPASADKKEVQHEDVRAPLDALFSGFRAG